MKGTLKNQLRRMEAEKAVMKFLEENGPQRPSVIGLRCKPHDVKNSAQWANDILLILQQKDMVESYRIEGTTGVFYKVKNA